MFKFIKNLFVKEDWILFDTLDGHWVNTNGNRTGNCFYNIEFSPNLNKFRLICEGKDPKEHQMYSEALKKLAEYNRALLNDPARIRDEKLKQLGI